MEADYVTNKAVSLLKKLHGIVFVTKEFGGAVRDERPDALLFNSSGTFLVETKVTRQDFLNDRKKTFRAEPSQGVGKYRYYACPEGLIKPEELPERWGLIYVRDKNKRAIMPVGYGGAINIGEEKHPEYYWKIPVLESYGSPLPEGCNRYSYDNPEHPANVFEFKERCLQTEWYYMYALCGRLREGKFMQNIWHDGATES
jgi:hypothetical protein